MSTDDLLVRRERSDDSQSLSRSPSAASPVPPPTAATTPASASGSSFDRLRNTFRRTESISSQIFSHISTQFSNAAAAAAASEVIDGTTTYPYPEQSTPMPAPPVAPPAPEAGTTPSPSKIMAKRLKRGEFDKFCYIIY
ncbi:hypothetical protein KR200_011910 [Drosophila serrata]|nr:hypothetical protein KR200_011910 [Drosophila serrata]